MPQYADLKMQSLSAKHEIPIKEITSRSVSVSSTATSAAEEEPQHAKRPKRRGVFNMFGKAKGVAPSREAMLNTEEMVGWEAELW